MSNYKWEKEFEDKIKEKIKAIDVLRDISIADDELLKLTDIIKFYLERGYFEGEKESLSLTRFLVELAYKEYNEKKYWDFVFNKLNIERNIKYQTLMGELSYKTLKRNQLPYTHEGKKFVGSLLLNTYVPQNYLENFYKFLQKFYIRELSQTFDKDVVLEAIKELQEYLENEKQIVKITDLNDKPSTSYLLLTVKKAMYLNKKSFEKYIYNYLEVFDSYWWENNIKKELFFEKEEEIFKEWFNRKIHIAERKTIKNKEKQYKKPTVKLTNNNRLIVYIPKQKVMNIEDYNSYIYYKVKIGNKIIQGGKLSAFSSLDKVVIEQEKFILDYFDYNMDLVIESSGIELIRYKISDNPFIIFNQDSEIEKITNLKDKTDYIIYSEIPLFLKTKSIEKKLSSKVNIINYDEDENMKIEALKKLYYLGKTPVYEVLDIQEKNFKIKGDDSLKIYKEFPKIFIKTLTQESMIKIEVNELRYKLDDFKGYYENYNDGVILDLKDYFKNNSGYIQIRIDNLKENKKIYKENFYILNFDISLDKNEYYFNEKAVFSIRKFKNVYLEHNYNLAIESDKYEVSLINSSKIKLKTKKEIIFYELPIFKWKFRNELSWDYNQFLIWCDDFKGELELSIPNGKNPKLELGDKKIIDCKKVQDSFIFDLNRLSDEFRINDDKIYQVKLIIDNRIIIIGEVIAKIFIENIAIGYQKNAQHILGQFTIYGKGEYFIDIIDTENKSQRILEKKLKKEAITNELISLNHLLNHKNYQVKIGYYEGKANKFFSKIKRTEQIVFNGRLQDIEEEIKIEDRLYRENTIQIDRCIVDKKTYNIRSFYIKSIEKINDNRYKGLAYYNLKNGERRYFSYNNPFEFEMKELDEEDGIIFNLIDKNEEIPIFDSYFKRLKTDEPVEDKHNYERWLIPDEYRFKIIKGE